MLRLHDVHHMFGQKPEEEMNTQDDLDLSVIPMKPSYWETWSINMAHAFVWGGFWVALISAWREGDWGLGGVP